MKLTDPQVQALRAADDGNLYQKRPDGRYHSQATIDGLIFLGLISARFPNWVTVDGREVLRQVNR